VKALIIGGGIAGLSTAWALARRGVQVELFEQGPLPNPRASSYDEHRIIRHAYGAMAAVLSRLWRGFHLLICAAMSGGGLESIRVCMRVVQSGKTR